MPSSGRLRRPPSPASGRRDSPEHPVHEPFRPLRLLSPEAFAVEPEAAALQNPRRGNSRASARRRGATRGRRCARGPRWRRRRAGRAASGSARAARPALRRARRSARGGRRVSAAASALPFSALRDEGGVGRSRSRRGAGRGSACALPGGPLRAPRPRGRRGRPLGLLGQMRFDERRAASPRAGPSLALRRSMRSASARARSASCARSSSACRGRERLGRKTREAHEVDAEARVDRVLVRARELLGEQADESARFVERPGGADLYAAHAPSTR